MTEKIVCSVVVPLYNEEEVLLETYKRLKKVMDSINEAYEIVFVNDGSRDKTAAMAYEICNKDKTIKLVDFARNFGHQTAITAGMDYCEGEAIVVIDADLQDPPELIPKMLEKWREGYDVVYGKRIERKGETFFKKITAKVFYRFLRSMTDVEIPVDAGDFRLIDRKVCDALKLVNERNRYIRGIISWLGFKQIGIEFSRDKRFAGETKYPLKKMIKFAFDAITSFSYKPLKLASYFGIFLSMLSFIYLLVVVYTRLFTEHIQPGWASTLAVNLFFNGITLIILGIIGEYVGRIYDEAKGRPLYIVRQTKNISDDKSNKVNIRK
ncbi:MAG: glycosyltransferase family 2 protein [Clostridiaceae bacterium]|nr:glycosyltransferase family 2 protein [Clostridiaceae bacterium]